jgi:xanthine dehydrogenase accessory factor
MIWWQPAKAAFDQGEACILVRVLSISGSAPREAGATMIVFESEFAGTVGGGALEHRCMQRARDLQKEGTLVAGEPLTENWILGPDIGQCCGGAVDLTLQLMDEAAFEYLAKSEEAARASLPEVVIFGAGHVGGAIARALTSLPVRSVCIDSRAELLVRHEMFVETRLVDDPVAEMDHVSAGALVFVMSHSHDLDYDLCQAALERNDLAFVGLIGSSTKKARFFQRMERQGFGKDVVSRLTCPIGIDGITGKEPAVIAASVAAQILKITSQMTDKMATSQTREFQFVSETQA